MQEAIDNFTNLTGYDLSNLLTGIDLFYTRSLPELQGYYGGKLDKVNPNTIKFLYKLQVEIDNVLQLFQQYQVRFNTVRDWELLDSLEAFRTGLATIDNMPKYLRSGRVGARYTTAPTRQVTVPTSNSIEYVLRKNTGSLYTQDDWVLLATSQNLTEEVYGPDAEPITITIPAPPRQGYQLQSVVGYPAGIEALGRDLDRNLNFTDDDLTVLEPADTRDQSFTVLLELQQEDIPEYPTMGLDGIVGMNRGTINFKLPAIMRQLRQTFDTDDSFVNLNIKNLQIIADSIQLDITVNTINGEPLNQILTA